MAMTESEHRAHEAHVRARMARRRGGQQAYEVAIRRRLEAGDTAVEHAFGRKTRYSLAQPGPFTAGMSAAFLARQLASRHYGFGTRVTFERGARDSSPAYVIQIARGGFWQEVGSAHRTKSAAMEAARERGLRARSGRWRIREVRPGTWR
jgi:hypothetical protein